MRWSGLDVEGADGGGAGEAVRRAQSMVLALDNDNASLGGPCGAAAFSGTRHWASASHIS